MSIKCAPRLLETAPHPSRWGIISLRLRCVANPIFNGQMRGDLNCRGRFYLYATLSALNEIVRPVHLPRLLRAYQHLWLETNDDSPRNVTLGCPEPEFGLPSRHFLGLRPPSAIGFHPVGHRKQAMKYFLASCARALPVITEGARIGGCGDEEIQPNFCPRRGHLTFSISTLAFHAWKGCIEFCELVPEGVHTVPKRNISRRSISSSESWSDTGSGQPSDKTPSDR